jgi:hypothetical protein
MNSRAKGKRIELDAVRALRWLGLEAERTVQYEGRGSAGDIRLVGAPALHLECKGREVLSAQRFMDQADRDCPDGRTPAVIMRENRGQFLIMCYLADFWDIARYLDEAKAEAGRLATLAVPAPLETR